VSEQNRPAPAVGAVFQIFCTYCKRETMARKHARRRLDDFGGYAARGRGMKWCGVNTCLRCGALYDAPLPKDQIPNGQRGPGVSGVAEDKTL